MNIQHERILIRLADILISVVAVFLLADAMLGFTRHQAAAPPRPRLVTRDATPASLSASCVGGFSNQRTIDGKTQVASHGTPFNAYQLTFTNLGSSAIKIHGVTVNLADNAHHVFARQRISILSNGAALTLGLGQSHQVVETAGIKQPVASCEVLSWLP